HLREAATGKEIGQFPGDHSWDLIHGGALKPIPRQLCVVAFLPDGKRLATVSNPFVGRDKKAAGIIRLWDIATKADLQSFECPGGPVLSFQTSPNGDLLAWVGDFPALVLKNVTQSKLLGRFTLEKGFYVRGALSPDEKVVALEGQKFSTDPYVVNPPFLEVRD